MSDEMSQVQVIGLPKPKSWDDYEAGCMSTFGGGHRTDGHLDAFQHGMGTVFNLLRSEFPPAQQCKSAPALYEACKAALQINALTWDRAVSSMVGVPDNARASALMERIIEIETQLRAALTSATPLEGTP